MKGSAQTNMVAAEREVELLLEMVATEPRPLQTDPELGVAERNEIRHADLLGLHVALLPIAPPGEDPLVSPEALLDPIATRELSETDRASLPARRHVLVLRAHYRNRYGLRGLRLLQTLVRIVAADELPSVLLVDRDRFPSDTVSTHFMFPNTLARLERLGVLDRLREDGALRDDVEPIQVCRLIGGVATVADQSDLEPTAVRPMIEVVADGLLK